MTLTARWSCYGCDAAGEGTPAAVDKAAEKHTREAGHSTCTYLTPTTTTKEASRVGQAR